MGLDDLIDFEQNAKTTNLRYYGYDEREEIVWDWIDEFQSKFPEEINCDFVEIAPADVKYNAKAYWKKRNGQHIQYMRVSESAFNLGDWRARQSVLHEMVHLFTFQTGHKNVSDGSRIFTWLCGQVGCVINQIHTDSKQWTELAEHFIDDDMKMDNLVED